MPLPGYYNELYVAFCTKTDGRVKGSGICYNGTSLVTCAHVVNSALGRPQTDMTDAVGGEVQVRFSQSTQLDPLKMYKARITVWGPASAPAGSKFTPRYDVAVLELVAPEEVEVILPYANELRFSSDDISGEHHFSCTSHNTAVPGEDIVPITGSISIYLPAEGKTTLSTSLNMHDAFLRPGSSGSPVYSETLDGIAGIADQLIDDKQEIRYAFMVDARRLADFIPDIIVHQPSLKIKSRSTKKYLCDRQQVIEGIYTEKTKAGKTGNLFFLWGDDEQEGKAFANRYKHHFLNPADPTNSNITIEVDLPTDISNLAFFQSGFLENISNAAARSNKKMVLKSGDDILTAYEALKHVKNKLFFFKIIDFNKTQTACFEWFINAFLEAGKKVYPEDLHVIILFEFGEYDTEAPAKRAELFKLFGDPTSFPLEDVTKTHIKAWISTFGEAEGSPFIIKLKELLRRPDNTFPMLDIFDQFEDALREISDKERL